MTTDDPIAQFLKDLLPRVHPHASLGPEYFSRLIDALDEAEPSYRVVRDVAGFAQAELSAAAS